MAYGYCSIPHIPNDVLEYETYSSNIRNTKKAHLYAHAALNALQMTQHTTGNRKQTHTYLHATYAVQMSLGKTAQFHHSKHRVYPNTVLVEGRRVQFMFSLCTQQFSLHVCLCQKKKIVLLFFRFSNWKKFHLILFSWRKIVK